MRNSLTAGKFCLVFFSAASLCLDIFFWLFFEELLVVFPRIQKKKKKATRAQRWELGWIFFGAGSTAAVAQVWFALYWLIPELWNAETHLHLYLKYFYFPWETWSEFWVFLALGWFGVEEKWLHLTAVVGAPAAPGFQVYPPAPHSRIMHILLPKMANLCIFYIIDR